MSAWDFQSWTGFTHLAFLLAGFVLAVVICIRFRKELRGTARFSLPVAITATLLVLAPALAGLLTTLAFLARVRAPSLLRPFLFGLVMVTLGAAIAFLLARLYVGAGLLLALHEGLNPFPLLSRLWGQPPQLARASHQESPSAPEATPPAAAPVTSGQAPPSDEPPPSAQPPTTGQPATSGQPAEPQEEQPGTSPDAATLPPGEEQRPVLASATSQWRGWKASVLVVAACVLVNVYSVALLRVTGARPSELVRRRLMLQQEREGYERAHAAGRRWRPGVTLPGAAVLTYVAINEELVFRMFWLRLLARALKRFRWRRLAAVLVTAAVWAVGHGSMLEPTWVKLTQIFVVGLVVGYVYLRAGIEGAIATHASLNLAGPWLITW